MQKSIQLEAGAEVLLSLLNRTTPYLVVSPPRGCSTAFSRALSQHPEIGPYYHEPCDLYSYEGSGVDTIVDALKDMKPGSLIKEMSFQFRDLSTAMLFLRNAHQPPVFLVRDPHKTIESRIRMVLGDLAKEPGRSEAFKQRVADAATSKNYAPVEDLLTDDVFPISRTGWDDIGKQMQACREEGIDFVVADAARFRSNPKEILEGLCGHWGLDFDPCMLSWEPRTKGPAGALSGQDAWYAKVAASKGVLPPQNLELQPEQLPPKFRKHLPEAMQIYRNALASKYVL